MGDGRRASSTACAGWGSTGTKGRTSAARMRPTSSRSAIEGYRALRREAGRGRARLLLLLLAPRLLQQKRQAAEAAGGGWVYDRTCCALGRRKRWPRTKRRVRRARCASRFRPARRRSPISCTARSASTTRTSKTSSILRSDRQPTYHLSVVADDIDMAITPRRPRGRSHLEHAEAGAAVRSVRGGAPAASRTCR